MEGGETFVDANERPLFENIYIYIRDLEKYRGRTGKGRREMEREKRRERERELEWSVLGVAGRLIERGFPWARVDIRANEAFPRKPGGGLSCGEGLRHQWGC